MKKIAIITGASSGMGLEFALLTDKTFKSVDEIWLIARRYERLTELKDRISKPCLIISEDINDVNFINFYKKALKQEDVKVKLLINCAGYGIMGRAGREAIEVETGMIDTNCKALTAITNVTIPFMSKNSRIINLASSAGFMPQPYFAIYAATKTYVLSYSRALNIELKDKKIYVTAVCPGPVSTEFFSIAEKGSKQQWYKKYFMAKPEDVVKKALTDSINRKEISVYGLSMRGFRFAAKVIPHKVILNIINLISKEAKEEDI